MTYYVLAPVSIPPCSTNEVDQFMDFVYLSQVIQAICVDAETQHYRRMLSTEGVYTRGALYWQLVSHPWCLINQMQLHTL